MRQEIIDGSGDPSLPTNHNNDDEEINLFVKERRIYSSNNREKLFRTIPINSTKRIETICDKINQSINHAIDYLCQTFEKILDTVTVPRKLAFILILSLTIHALVSNQKRSEELSGYISHPHHGNVISYYRPETFSSSSITSPLEDDGRLEIIKGVELAFLSREPSIPIPISLDNIADVSKVPDQQEIPFYFHIPRAGGSTIKDILGSCLGLVGATDVGSTGEDMVNSTKLEVITTKEGSRYVNVDTTTLEGIESAKKLKLVESGLVDYIVTQRLHAAAGLFTEVHKGRMFTIMRDPIDRAVSLFYYLAIADWEPTYDPSLATMSIEMWARSDDRIEYNWMTRFLSNNLENDLSQYDLDVAKEILRKKSLIGFLEAKDESMMRFQKYFKWDINDSKTRECIERILDWGWSNKHSHPHIDVDSETYQLLLKSNEYDIELYEYAKLLFEAQAVLF